MRLQKGHWNSLNTTTVTLAALPPRAGESPRGTLYSSRAAGAADGAGGAGGGVAGLSQAAAAQAMARKIRALFFMLPSWIREREHAKPGTVSGAGLLAAGDDVHVFGGGHTLADDVHRGLVTTYHCTHGQDRCQDGLPQAGAAPAPTHVPDDPALPRSPPGSPVWHLEGGELFSDV